MKIIIKLLVLTLVMSSCGYKKYKYVETGERPELFGGGIEIKEKDPETIWAESDSAAFYEAYTKFTMSLKVSEEMNDEYGDRIIAVPVSFALYNNKGIDISKSIALSDPEKLMKEIHHNIFVFNNVSDDEAEQKIDSVKIKELMPYFKTSTDEFDPDQYVIYKPKSAPEYANRNALYCYFYSDKNHSPLNFRFTFQYYADDWLFIKMVKFSIDGKAYEFVPLNTKSDSGSGKIWEWFDERITGSDKELINALANAKTAKMKLIGSNYYKITTIKQSDIKDIKRTLELFQAMGGEL